MGYSPKPATVPIDRKALVCRHIPTLNRPDSLSPFIVGNGSFAFGVGITGLQTFTSYYDKGIPLETESQWGWDTDPNPHHYRLSQTLQYHNTYGREVPYAALQNTEAGKWLRANPHRLDLARIGFVMRKADGKQVRLSDISAVHQSEDIWEGIIKSRFSVDNKTVSVETACHPDLDQIGVVVRSDLLDKGNAGIEFSFPYGSTSWGNEAANWDSPGKYITRIVRRTDHSVTVMSKLSAEEYFAEIQWEGEAEFKEVGIHSYLLSIIHGKEFAFVCNFSESESGRSRLPDAEETFAASKIHWKHLWMTGGAVDLSGSTDPRASELERRIVLSEYLTAVQCAGSMPPQETGLTCNSWFGKFHLEMYWWHVVHFVLWGHPEVLERGMRWFEKILPRAEQTAKMQGYAGARWPKMVAYDGRESPSDVGVFLIWQEPHPIYYAELLYRYYKTRAILEGYKNVVFETADFMASYAHWDAKSRRYVLGPPLIPAQEIYRPDSTMNPTFELSYWAYGLRTAQKWRERLGLPKDKKWQNVLDHLSKLPMHDGLYQDAETAMNTFQDAWNRRDHPALLGAFGMLPNDAVNVAAMRRTLVEVMHTWDWKTTWGWDYPLMAMTAARTGRPDLAVDALLMKTPKNGYLNDGNNYQTPRLPLYLPGNGGLLTAVAMMAEGWDGAPKVHAPGFPHNGKWVVRYEGLHKLP